MLGRLDHIQFTFISYIRSWTSYFSYLQPSCIAHLKKFIYSFLSMLCLHCRAGFSLVVVSSGYSLVVVPGFLVAVASLIAEHGLQGERASVAAGVVAPGLQSAGSIVVAQGLSCSMARGICQDQGWNLCLLNWHVDSLPLHHQRSPAHSILYQCTF